MLCPDAAIHMGMVFGTVAFDHDALGGSLWVQPSAQAWPLFAPGLRQRVDSSRLG